MIYEDTGKVLTDSLVQENEATLESTHQKDREDNLIVAQLFFNSATVVSTKKSQHSSPAYSGDRTTTKFFKSCVP